jgi:hypothetical protein
VNTLYWWLDGFSQVHVTALEFELHYWHFQTLEHQLKPSFTIDQHRQLDHIWTTKNFQPIWHRNWEAIALTSTVPLDYSGQTPKSCLPRHTTSFRTTGQTPESDLNYWVNAWSERHTLKTHRSPSAPDYWVVFAGMDIKQIVNTKGAKGAAAAAAASNGAAQDLQLIHSIQQATSMPPMSDTGSERGNSPHDSEHSRYSAPRYGPMNGMNGAPATMRYPSPTAMQNPMPMMQQPYQPNSSFDNSMMQQGGQPVRQPGGEGAPKAFPCSTCGKGFARRSDLARHGM